ncbi:MAG: TonB-dependent receptor, partial [Bacteroidales bacterium]|nr:TonB-dependent receptor [Bacteroidales bacterium]
NALSGVFDLNLRTGNSDKRETTLQVGSSGVELATEGSFKNGERASYLVNYRYSTFGILENLLPQVTGLPTSSDLSLKMNFQTRKAGVFSLWSINGKGKIAFDPKTDSTEWKTNYDNYQYDIHYDLTASGLNHRKIIGKKSYLFSSVSYSATRYTYQSTYLRQNLTFIPVTDQNEVNSGLSLYSYLNHKFNNRHSNRTGLTIRRIAYNYDVQANSDVATSDSMDYFVDSKGATSSFQFYSQSKYYLRENLVVNAGLYLYYFNLNNDYSIEPRLGIKWDFNPTQSLSFAYGKHSKPEPLRTYLMEVPTPDGWSKLNENISITKAHHFVLGYDWNPGDFTHLKIEPYYQILYDVPVIPDSSFSMINYKNDMFFNSKLTNEGTGRNIGVDVTFEHFLEDGFYYLFTTSVFDSKYKGGDGVERNSRYNQNYVLNLLMGKEWQVRKNNIFSLNGKFTILGGQRYAPVDENKSIQYQFVVYDNSKIYEEQSPTNYYLDLSINYRINKARFSQTIIFQIKNLLMQKEFLGHAYNYETTSVEPYELTIMYPFFSYKIEF